MEIIILFVHYVILITFGQSNRVKRKMMKNFKHHKNKNHKSEF